MLSTPLTALPVGYFCFVRKAWSPRVAFWWKIAAILILVNVVVHAQLSTPSPFRVFVTDPPVTSIAYWPYILLPGFLVPLAWLGHATSLIQLRRRQGCCLLDQIEATLYLHRVSAAAGLKVVP